MKQKVIEIETPEKILFTYSLAEIGTRIAAYAIDSIVQIIFVGLTILIFALVSPVNFFSKEFNMSKMMMLAFLFLLYFFLQWGYFLFFEIIMAGQSPGKSLMGIRVIRRNGESMDFSTLTIRNLLRGIDGFPLLHIMGGAISILDSYSRRLGDIIADTLVVKDIQFNLKEPDFNTILFYSDSNESFTNLVVKLSEEDLYILRRFLNEKNKLNPVKREEIAFKLAMVIKSKLKIKADVENPITFLEKVYRSHTYENIK